jgi:hypothetical protein
MFKFAVIESPQYFLRNKLKKLMAEKMQFFQGGATSLSDRLAPTFIIAYGEGKKILGGACLVKKNLIDIQDEVKELLTPPTFRQDYVWECSTIYVDVSRTYPRSSHRPEELLRSFYQGLYAECVAFGRRQDTNFIIMKLLDEGYIATKELGLWPYVVEIKPKNSSDGLFHGILPLTGRLYNAYQRALKP